MDAFQLLTSVWSPLLHKLYTCVQRVQCLQRVQLPVCVYCHLDWGLARSGTYAVLPWASTRGHLQFKAEGTCMDKVLHILSCVSSFMVKRGKSVTQRKLSCSGSRLKCPDFDRTDATWVRISPRVFNWKNRAWSGALYKQIWWTNCMLLIRDPSFLCLLTTLVINAPRPSSFLQLWVIKNWMVGMRLANISIGDQ